MPSVATTLSAQQWDTRVQEYYVKPETKENSDWSVGSGRDRSGPRQTLATPLEMGVEGCVSGSQACSAPSQRLS